MVICAPQMYLHRSEAASRPHRYARDSIDRFRHICTSGNTMGGARPTAEDPGVLI